jgi:2-dehydro-3-deoxyphosphooctonate aldolase (KDO 8-P synthase)
MQRRATRIKTRTVQIGEVRVGGGHPLALIGGPCVIESEAHCLMMARELKAISAALPAEGSFCR